MFKNLLVTIALIFSAATSATADYTFIVPQKPGGGTSVWTQIIATELEKYLDEKINIVHIPGANDIPGFNKFHNTLQTDDKTVMVSHGGNGVSYLVDNVDYDYYQYDPIAMMNLTIVNGYNAGFDPYNNKIIFSAGSGMSPDMMAHILLKGGPNLTMEQAEIIFDTEYTYVKGLSGGDRRLGFLRNELTATRESPASWNKNYAENSNVQVWFSHGVFDLTTGKIGTDPNFPSLSIREVFEHKWGVEPSGEFWEAYELVRNFRDVMQKALWTHKNNPNTIVLREAFQEMASNSESMAIIYKKTGNYDWIIGNDMIAALDILRNQIKTDTITNLVNFLQFTGKPAVLKDTFIR